MKNRKLKVKYTGPNFKNKLRYGLFEDMADWVKYQRQQEREGNPLLFLMSYEDFTGRECNPCIKEIDNFDPISKVYAEDEPHLSELERDF